MLRSLVITLFLLINYSSYTQKTNNNSEILKLKDEIQILKNENSVSQKNYENLIGQYQQTNDRLNNYLAYTGIIAAIFGVFIALAGIYIGFESLKAQSQYKEAITTLSNAKDYVNNKKDVFDALIAEKGALFDQEYNRILKLLKDKLINDIEIETSKVKILAEKKTEELNSVLMDNPGNKTLELLEKRLEFFENVGIPDDPEILFSKAKILREKTMTREAIQLLEKLVGIRPLHDEAYWYLGSEYAKINEHDKSIENYKKEIEINPSSSSALNNIALQYKAKNNLLKALECLDKAIEIDKNNELYRVNRIAILTLLNSVERVIDDYVELIRISPDKQGYYTKLIGLLKNEGKFDDIFSYLNAAIEHFKDNNSETSNSFKFLKASFLGEQKREADAIDILQGLIDCNYNIANCYLKIAELKNNLGNVDEAKSILINGLAMNPLSSDLYIFKAFIESSQNMAEAKVTIDLGGENINNEAYYFAGGRFFLDKGSLQMSQYCYEGALRIIEDKLSRDKLAEGDIMNYYETSIIVGRSLETFDEKFRKFIVSERYLVVLTVIDVIRKLAIRFDDEQRQLAVAEIRNLNFDAKDKTPLKWNFKDILLFTEKSNSEPLITFTKNLIRYINREIKLENI